MRIKSSILDLMFFSCLLGIPVEAVYTDSSIYQSPTQVSGQGCNQSLEEAGKEGSFYRETFSKELSIIASHSI